MKTDLTQKLTGVLEKIDEKNFYYVFGGALLLVFLLYYFVLMKPQLDSLAKINPEVKLLRDDIKKAEDDINKTAEYKAQVERLRGTLNEMQLKVRVKSEVPLILERISKVAAKSNVRIEQIMPDPEDQDVLLENPDRIYYALPILLEARAGYHDFGRFINQLEATDIFLSVKTFTISSSSESRLHTVKLRIDAVVYEDNLGIKDQKEKK